MHDTFCGNHMDRGGGICVWSIILSKHPHSLAQFSAYILGGPDKDRFSTR